MARRKPPLRRRHPRRGNPAPKNRRDRAIRATMRSPSATSIACSCRRAVRTSVTPRSTLRPAPRSLAPSSRSATSSSAAATGVMPRASARSSTVVVVSRIRPRPATHAPVIAVRFLGDVDDAAGVGQEVGDIQRARRGKPLGHFGCGQLIVCPAHNDLEVEICHGIVRQDPTQRARAEDVGGVPRASTGSTIRAAPARTASSTLSWLTSEAMTTASRWTRRRMTSPPTFPRRARAPSFPRGQFPIGGPPQPPSQPPRQEPLRGWDRRIRRGTSTCPPRTVSSPESGPCQPASSRHPLR